MASWGKGQFYSIIILLAVVIDACSGKDAIPDDVLAAEDMTGVLIQVHLLESKIGRLTVGLDSSKVLYDYFETLMLSEKGIDTTLYYHSLDYYTAHPEQFTPIYAAVVDSLLEMENKEKLRQEEEKRLEEERRRLEKLKQDSLKKLRDSLGIKPDSVILEIPDTLILDEQPKLQLRRRDGE